MSRYREQYDRMKRRYARFAERSVERPATVDSLMDEAQAFFECCLHLRDWIKNDEELPRAIRDAAFPYIDLQGTKPGTPCQLARISVGSRIADEVRLPEEAGD